MTQVGKKYKHPIHGALVITQVLPNAAEEFIDDEWRQGDTIHGEFDRFIPGVRWRTGDGVQCRSKLVFHSYYLKRLEVEEQ